MKSLDERRLPVLITLILLSTGLLLACGKSGSASEATATAAPAAALRGAVLNPPRAKPAFTLTDTTGRPFDFRRETEGSVTLLFFGYTHCPDICPTHMALIAHALKGLPADVTSHIKVVFVSVDPERDTAERLRTWLGHFSAEFIGLTGSQAEVDAAQTAAGVPLAYRQPFPNGDYSVAHAATVLAYTTDNVAHFGYPLGTSVEDWSHDLPRLVQNGWTHR